MRTAWSRNTPSAVRAGAVRRPAGSVWTGAFSVSVTARASAFGRPQGACRAAPTARDGQGTGRPLPVGRRPDAVRGVGARLPGRDPGPGSKVLAPRLPRADAARPDCKCGSTGLPVRTARVVRGTPASDTWGE